MRTITIDNERLTAICRAYHVSRLSLFGSVLHGEDTPESDLDLLVEFDGRTPGIRFFNLQEELSTVFGKTVDLNTTGFLSKYFRDSVSQEAQVIYAA